jgi:sugar/nucleoside kinase (ribokinase family)
MCKKITLYGHLTVDRILIDFKETASLGGIANVWSGLVSLGQGLNVELKPLSIGQALILVDKKNNYRIGRGCLNIESKPAEISNADWHHISYINQLNDTSFISQLNGIVSADITKEEPEKVIPNLQYLDYLFIAQEDLFMDIQELGKRVKGFVIVHHPKGSIFSDGKYVEHYNLPKELFLSDVNVLGAGDYFASGFIKSIIDGNDVMNSVIKSHEVASNLIKQNLL